MQQRESMNPDLWGPEFWKALHLCAQGTENQTTIAKELCGPELWQKMCLCVPGIENQTTSTKEKEIDENKQKSDDENSAIEQIGIDKQTAQKQNSDAENAVIQQAGVDQETAKKALLYSNNDIAEAIVRILEQKGNTDVRSDVELVMIQTNATRDAALRSLVKNHFDLVDAIMELSVQ